MHVFAVKHGRLAAAAALIFMLFVGSKVVFASAGELEITLSFKSRVVPPLSLRSYPGGLSQENAEIGLLNFSKTKLSWSVEISPNNEYTQLILSAGQQALLYPMAVRLDKYIRFTTENQTRNAWIHDMATFTGTTGGAKKDEGVQIPLDFVNIPKPVKSIIGEGGPRITVTGSRRISFSGRSEWDEDLVNTGTFRQSKFPSLHMEQTSRFKIRGEIGSKINIEIDQDSNRDVDLANTLRLRYQGEEDEIIQTIEAGNTNLALPNAQFIGFSQNVQGLFGIKATARVGNIELTMITSQEKGTSEKSTFRAGAKPSENIIKDYQYLHNVYFWLGFNFTSDDSLIDVKLFKRGTERDPYGYACVDPHYGPGANETGDVDTLYYITSQDSLRGEWEKRNFMLMEENEYSVYPAGWYVVLEQQLPEDEVLGAYIKYAHRDPVNDTTYIRQEGKITAGDTLVLKLIRDPDTDTSFVSWDLEWRNVYYLGSRELSPEGFELQIYKGHGQLETDTLDQDGTPYIELFGFDQYNNSNQAPMPDGIFDFDVTTDIDASRGHLIFHQPEPFAADFLNTPNPAVYNYRYNNTSRAEAQQYYIHVKTAKRDNTFSLGRTNIIEGSEVVKMGDGRVLKKGVDYNIVYEIGQITFLTDEALNPGADISVDFEYAPFFLPEKKSLFGMAAKYSINDKSSIALAGMYRKESSREYRPRVGQEPRRAMIWDSNFVLHFDPQFLTTAVDALPLIETDAPSMIEITGEVAQSFPNPNLRNRAYIDDFEGSREYTDLVMRRGIWTAASVPTSENNDAHRRVLYWYNPYDPVRIDQIWPDRSDFREHENRQDVLDLAYFPDTSSSDPDIQGWAGIMRPLYAGLSDQSRTNFIEVWYYPDPDGVDLDGEPALYIEAGKISEDIDDDGLWDTEDVNRNGVFEENEDNGLDGWTDAQEREFLGMPGVEDPSGDNWYYNSRREERYNYSMVNGTQGNRNDPDRLNRFDTEDINNNKSLDLTDAFYRYRIDLNNPAFVDEITDSDWRLLRIPFQDSTVYTKVGNPDFENINFVRIWLTGASREYRLRFASIQFVGNKWQQMALPDPVYVNGIPLNALFEVTVKNTQEHANSYSSPPEVFGEYNQETGVQEKEQSLVLRYGNLYPGQKVGTYWSLLTPQDYTLYNKMKMYVHGEESASPDLPLYFFFRLGSDSLSNFYEYRVRLQPGWDDDNNVDFNFEELTALKSHLQANHPDDYVLADTTVGFEKRYRVKGNPSLSQVKFYVLGIEYDSLIYRTSTDGDSVVVDTLPAPFIPASGEVWCDELLLTDVRKNSDFAGRVSAQISLADLGNVSISYSNTGADFFPLSVKQPLGSTLRQQSISGRFSLDKFFPPAWGLALPLNLSWSRTLDLPRLKTGSDIIVPPELRESERTENKTWSVSTSERFRKNTKNWLWNLTLNRFESRYVYTKRYGVSPVQPVSNSTTYEASGKYDLTPRITPFFKPFSWTRRLFMPASISETKMFFLPTALRFDAGVNGTDTYSITNRGIVSSSHVRDLAMTQTYGMGVFSALKTDLSITSNRDISDPQQVRLSLNPSEIKLGRERNYGQSFSSSFTPKISRQFAPRVQFTSRYSDNSDLARNPDSTRSTQLNANLRGDFSIDVFQLLGLKKLLTAPQRPSPEAPDKNKAGQDQQKAGKDQPEEGEAEGERGEDEAERGEDEKSPKKKIPNPLAPIRKVFSILGTLKPVTVGLSTDKTLNRSGLYERPSWKYTFGFADNPNVRRKEYSGFASRDQITYTQDYSFSSGITPLKILDVNSSYKLRNTVTRGTNEPTRTKSTEFPRFDANLSGLEKLPLLKSITRTVGLQTVYARKIDITGNADTGELKSRSTNDSFSPLVGLNLNLNKGIRATVRYEYSTRKNENLRQEGGNQRIDYGQDRAFKASISYTLTAPQGLKIPIFGKVKFDSQLTMSLDVGKKYRKTWFVIQGTKSVDVNSVETSIEPKASYRFSAKITGGLNARWVDSRDTVQKRNRHIRELGIWTELRF